MSTIGASRPGTAVRVSPDLVTDARTGERTLLAHLTKAFADHLSRAFRHD